jgi:hypothetical protein
MAMGADYSFELIYIETYAAQFIGHNKLFLGSVNCSGVALSVVQAPKARNMCKIFSLVPLKKPQRKLRQSKCLLFNF